MYEIEIQVPNISGPAVIMDKARSKDFQISYRSTRHAFSKEATDVTIFVLTFAKDISVGVIAAGLYDLIKKHSRSKSNKMVIDRKIITVDKGQIKKIVEEHISREKNE